MAVKATSADEAVTQQVATLLDENEQLRSRVGELGERVIQLTHENSQLRTENTELRNRTVQLSAQNAQLSAQNTELQNEKADLRDSRNQLRRENEEYKKESEEYKKESEEYKRENEEYKADYTRVAAESQGAARRNAELFHKLRSSMEREREQFEQIQNLTEAQSVYNERENQMRLLLEQIAALPQPIVAQNQGAGAGAPRDESCRESTMKCVEGCLEQTTSCVVSFISTSWDIVVSSCSKCSIL